MTETIGGGWSNLNGGAANIAFPGCHPQGLHQDQAASGWTTPNAPTMLNSMYVLQDVDHMNGGTLFIPGAREHPPTRSHNTRAGPQSDGVVFAAQGRTRSSRRR